MNEIPVSFERMVSRLAFRKRLKVVWKWSIHIALEAWSTRPPRLPQVILRSVPDSEIPGASRNDHFCDADFGHVDSPSSLNIFSLSAKSSTQRDIRFSSTKCNKRSRRTKTKTFIYNDNKRHTRRKGYICMSHNFTDSEQILLKIFKRIYFAQLIRSC